jgi:hypothetical protein
MSDWIEPNEGKPVDIDLGDGHTLTWTRYQGEIEGGIIRHQKSDSPSGFCEAHFSIRGSKFNAQFRQGAAGWDMTGGFESPTLSPSFVCHCGDHGWICEGKWVKA